MNPNFTFQVGFLHTCTLFQMYLWTSPSHHLPTNAHPSQRQLLSHGTNRHNHWSHKHKKASVFWSLWLRKPTKVGVFLAMRFWCLPRIYWNRIEWISSFERHDFGTFQAFWNRYSSSDVCSSWCALCFSGWKFQSERMSPASKRILWEETSKYLGYDSCFGQFFYKIHHLLILFPPWFNEKLGSLWVV